MTAGDGRVIPRTHTSPYSGKPARGGGYGPSPVSALRPPENARPLVQQPICLPSLRVRLRRGGAAGPNRTAATTTNRETGSGPPAPPLRVQTAERWRRCLGRMGLPAALPWQIFAGDRGRLQCSLRVIAATSPKVDSGIWTCLPQVLWFHHMVNAHDAPWIGTDNLSRPDPHSRRLAGPHS
jgi:hypothetical protein